MEQFKKLLAKCKCSVALEVNGHRDNYQTAEQRLEDFDDLELTEDLDAEVRRKMIETNTIVDLHFYPDTPIGFFKILHYDLDLALAEALSCFD